MDAKTADAKTAGQDRNLQDDLKESAHRIWLAGLGALALAEEEGSRLFSRLVDRGRDVESRGKVEVDKAKAKAETAWDDVSSRVKSKAEDWSGKVDETVSATLHRLGVPTRDEIRRLTERVEELSAKVELLRPRVTPAAAGHGDTGETEKPSARSAKSAAKV